MKKHTNSYQALTTDVAAEAIQDGMYIDAQDIRITTDKGESGGAIVNLKGTSLSFSIPLIGVFYNDKNDPSYYVTWVANAPQVIGYATLRNRIILFVADTSGTKSWIYDFRYDPATLTVLPSYPKLLYYSTDLNFKLTFPIEAIGRYESEQIQRVYWTDYNNFLRSVNIEDPDLQYFTTGVIDIFPNIKYVQPLLKQMLGSGNHPSGNYAIAYRLKTADGKRTLISPPGHMFHITPSSESESSTQSYVGGTSGEGTTKAFLIEFDTSSYLGIFTELEVIRMYYPSLTGTPQVVSVGSKEIDSNTLEFLITGYENTTFVLDEEEFNSKSYPFKTVKTLTQKDNSLVVSNIKEGFFNIQSLLNGESFDAKTKRYNSLSQDENDAFPLNPTKTNLELAFNERYNLDAHWRTDWHLNDQFKFKLDGTTLGGQGPNISYSFFVEKFSIDGQSTATGAGEIPNLSNQPDFTNHPLGYGVGLYNTTFANQASPFMSGVLKGYKRGETYRFGIVFYSKKGESSFVEYIGDIKFPDISEKDGVINDTGSDYWILSQQVSSSADGVLTEAYSLGIKFDISFASCPNFFNNEIESYQIVRLEREEKDKRRVTSGIIRMFHSVPIGAATGDFNLQGPGGTNNVLHLYGRRDTISGGFDEIHSFNSLNNDVSNINHPYNRFDVPGDFVSYLSPELSYRFNETGEKIASSPNASLLITGAYSNVNVISFSSQDMTGGENLAKNVEDRRYKARNVIPVNPSSREHIKLWSPGRKYLRMVDDFQYKDNLVGPFPGAYYLRNYYAQPDIKNTGTTANGSLNDPRNGIPNADVAIQSEISKGGTAIVGKIGKFLSDPIDSSFTDSSLYENFKAPSLVHPVDTSKNGTSFPVVDTVLPKNVIYGGFTQDVLENNIFIPASPIIDKNFNTGIKILDGDTFLNMFALQTSMVELQTDFYENDNFYRTTKSRTLSFVVESGINIDLDYGSTIKRGVAYTEGNATSQFTVLRQENNNTFTGITSYAKTSNMYGYNSAYSKEIVTLSFFIKPATLGNDGLINDIRSYLSNVKINNEDIDSWTQFPALSYYDVDDYGPINKILNQGDQVIFFQDSAIGSFSINPVETIPSSSGGSMQIGSGKGFSKHTYITKDSGSIHQYGIKATERGIYYFDALNKKIMFLSEGSSPLSDIKGVHSFLQFLPNEIFLRKENYGDNGILNKGVVVGKDSINNEITFAFKGSSNTKALLIDTLTNSFIHKPSVSPSIFIENGDIVLSPNPLSPRELHVHGVGDWGSFYGFPRECFITIVVNPEADLNKVLRTIEFNSIVRDNNKVITRNQTITAFRIKTEHQDTGKIPYSPNNIKRKFNKWRVKIPRDQLSATKRGRLRNTYFIVTLYYDNAYNKEIILNRLTSYYDTQIF